MSGREGETKAAIQSKPASLEESAPLWSRWRDSTGGCWQVVGYTEAGDVEYRSENGSIFYTKPMIGWRRMADEAPAQRERTLEEIAPIGSRWRDPPWSMVYTVHSYAPCGERAHLSSTDPGDGMRLAHRDWFTNAGRAERVEDEPPATVAHMVVTAPDLNPDLVAERFCADLRALAGRPPRQAIDDGTPDPARVLVNDGTGELMDVGTPEEWDRALNLARAAEPPPLPAHRWNPYLVRPGLPGPCCEACGLPKEGVDEGVHSAVCEPKSADAVAEMRDRHEAHVARLTERRDQRAAINRTTPNRGTYDPPFTGRGGAIWGAWEKVPR